MGAVRRNLPIVVLPVLLLVGVAVAIGLLRDPTYTSEARLNVGGLSLTQQSIPGYTTAVESLAVAYSRAIDAPAIVRPAARASGLSPTEVADSVSATPVQDSPVIRIRATSSDPDEAVKLAQAAAGALVEYAFQLNSGTTQSVPLRRRFLAASRNLRSAHAASARLKPNTPRWRAAQTEEDLARLQMQTAAALYQQSQAGQSTTNLVQRLAPAAPATSDRDSVLQQLAAAGLIAGLLIGVGLAVARENRLTARRTGEL